MNILEQFYTLRLCINEVLIDLRLEIRLTEEEGLVLNVFKNSLKPEKMLFKSYTEEMLIMAESTL